MGNLQGNTLINGPSLCTSISVRGTSLARLMHRSEFGAWQYGPLGSAASIALAFETGGAEECESSGLLDLYVEDLAS